MRPDGWRMAADGHEKSTDGGMAGTLKFHVFGLYCFPYELDYNISRCFLWGDPIAGCASEVQLQVLVGLSKGYKNL